jgi:hypothetical protein
VRALDENNIDYVVFGGNVLSYCRHGGHLIPFDDDIDLLIAATDAQRALVALRKIEDGRLIGAMKDKQVGAIADGNSIKAYFQAAPEVGSPRHSTRGNYRWKYVGTFSCLDFCFQIVRIFFFSPKKKIKKTSLGSFFLIFTFPPSLFQPYIDIWTYVELSTDSIRVRQHERHTYDYKKSLLFPTKRGKFFFNDPDDKEQVLEMWIPVNPTDYLNSQFPKWRDVCKVNFWDHRKEVAKPLNRGWKKTMPCAKLQSLHPEWYFVNSRLQCPSN